MVKLFVLLAFVAVAVGAVDVSHLFRGNNPYNNNYYRPFSSQYQQPYLRYQRGPQIAILRSDSNINSDGSFQYAYETENGIAAEERGQQVPYTRGSGTVAQGAYRYTSPEGVPVVVQYIADENGFQPQSNVLPTSPPIPYAILKSLQWNNAHPEEETD